MTRSRQRIGISICIDRGRTWRPGYDYLYVHRAYARAVAAVGGVPLLLCLDTPTDVVSDLDGLILTGGDDLPATWTDQDTANARTEDPERIATDRAWLEAFVEQSKPVLGICYGMQLINLHYGGSLLRSLKEQAPTALNHGGDGSVTHHRTRRLAASPLLTELPEDFETNSCHGQAIDVVAPGFDVTARATDGVIEAIEKNLVFGVEWHPESDVTCQAIYGAFLRICGTR